jgi:hypothetical protein
MSRPPYRALQVTLRIFSVLLAIGALFMIFSSRAIVVRVFLHPPEVQVSTLLLLVLKEMGGIVLMVSAMLFLASRDPERNVAIIDGLIVGLVILAVTPLLSFYPWTFSESILATSFGDDRPSGWCSQRFSSICGHGRYPRSRSEIFEERARRAGGRDVAWRDTVRLRPGLRQRKR